MRTILINVMLGLLVVFLMLGAPLQAARAQPGTEGDSAQKADQLFQKGKALYASGKVRDAREALLSAWTLKRSYDIAANLGTVELELGMNRDAAEHLTYSVRTFPSTGKKKNLAVTKQQLDEARKQVGALSIKANVDGAEVLVDGAVVGRAPMVDEVFVEAGARTVEAKSSGFATGRVVVQVAKGGTEGVTLTLVAVVAPVASVGAPPGPPSGSAVVAPLVPAGSSTGAPPPPPPRPQGEEGGASRALLVTGGVAGGVALGMGVVFAVLSNGKARDADTRRAALISSTGNDACAGAPSAACTDFMDAANAKRTFANAAFWSFVGAGAAGAGTLIYALTAPKRATTSGLRVIPIGATHGGGLQLGGVW